VAAVTRRRFLVLAASVTCGACVAPGSPLGGLRPIYANPGANEWPEELAQQAPEVQEMYRYALANREVLQYMPCYCGCVEVGHRSNYDCYVRDVLPDGRVQLDTMSFG
jgi:hypothetical protein